MRCCSWKGFFSWPKKHFFAHPIEGFKGCSFTTYRVPDGLFFVATQKKVFCNTCYTCFFCLCCLRRHLAVENRKQSECTSCMHTGILSMGKGPPLVALALNKAICILSDAVTLECSVPWNAPGMIAFCPDVFAWSGLRCAHILTSLFLGQNVGATS